MTKIATDADIKRRELNDEIKIIYRRIGKVDALIEDAPEDRLYSDRGRLLRLLTIAVEIEAFGPHQELM